MPSVHHHCDDTQQRGAIFALVLIVMVILAALVMGLNRDVRMDLGITRNLKLHDDSLNWADSGMNVAEEVIAMAIVTRGEDANATFDVTMGGMQYRVENPGLSLYNSTSPQTVNLMSRPDNATAWTVLAEVNSTFIGRMPQEGGSLIMAAGYEGVGKGAGSGATIGLYYAIQARGDSPQGIGVNNAAEVYRYIGGGR